MLHNISVFKTWHIHCHWNINQGKSFLKFLKEPQHGSLLQEHWHSHHILDFLSKGTVFVLASTPLTTQTAVLALQIEKVFSFFLLSFLENLNEGSAARLGSAVILHINTVTCLQRAVYTNLIWSLCLSDGTSNWFHLLFHLQLQKSGLQ